MKIFPSVDLYILYQVGMKVYTENLIKNLFTP